MLSENEGIVLERHTLLGYRPRPRSRTRPRSVWKRVSQTPFLDYEDEDENDDDDDDDDDEDDDDEDDDDEDEKQSTGHFRYLPLISLHSNCPMGPLLSSVVSEKA